MDRKRARYRNDSTIANDLLQSCEARGCHRKRMRTQIPISDDARSTRSVRSEPEHTQAGRARMNADADGEKKPKKRAPRKRIQKPVSPEEVEGEGQQDQEDPVPKKKRRKVA